MRLALLVGSLLVACGGSPRHATPPTPDPIPATAGPSCKDVATHLLTLGDRDPTKDDDDKAAAPLRARCEQDRWSDEARSCLATATSDPELDGCKAKLTDAQQKGFAAVAPKQDAPKDAWGGGEKAKDDDGDDDGGSKEDGDDDDSKEHHSRGPVKKGDKKGKATGDPCEGGE